MSFAYSIYGLQIKSSRRISLLAESVNTGNDLDVIWAADENDIPCYYSNWERLLTANLKLRKGVSEYTTHTEDGIGYKIVYHKKEINLVYFFFPHIRKVWIRYDANMSFGDIDSLFVGPGMGCILRLMGVVCLHASVVCIDGKAIAFLGKKEAGKSTMAAAFVKMGYKILADDVGVLKEKDGQIYVEPGYPKVRLRPKTLAAIHDGDAEQFPQVYTSRDSRYSDIDDNFYGHTLPLGAIYFLNATDGVGDAPIFEDVAPAQKIIKLGQNVFGSYVITKELRKEEFLFLGQLATAVPVRDIMLEHNLDCLDIQCQSIVNDFRQLQENNKG